MMNGRVTIQEFTEITGISRSTFYDKYRWSARYQKQFDMREHEENGRIHMDRHAVMTFARRKKGGLARGRSSVANRLGSTTERNDDSNDTDGGDET